jgi:hypothetical protein
METPMPVGEEHELARDLLRDPLAHRLMDAYDEVENAVCLLGVDRVRTTVRAAGSDLQVAGRRKKSRSVMRPATVRERN